MESGTRGKYLCKYVAHCFFIHGHKAFTTLNPYRVNNDIRRTLVIVDDEKSYADLLSQLLNDNLDCSVHTFYRPADALAALPFLKPNVVVSDYYMPEINGLKFIREATSLIPGSAFILITGHNMSGYMDELKTLPSIKSHLAKPFGWRQLASEVLRVWPNTNPPNVRTLPSGTTSPSAASAKSVSI